MKAYGVKIKDLARDCTGTAKFGTTKLLDKCACGKDHCRPSKDYRNRKRMMRQLGKKLSLNF